MTIRENTFFAAPDRYIHYLGPTTSGTTHDCQMLKNEFNQNLGLLDSWHVLVDLGYLGLVVDYNVRLESLPHRKPQRSKKDPETALSEL